MTESPRRPLCLVVLLVASLACNGPGGREETPLHAPPTVVLDATLLAEIKANVQSGVPTVRAPLDSIMSQAEALLDLPIVSLMDKPLLPPSGDRHDYLTRAPYFWPNPETSDGLPYIKRDGRVYEENRSGTDFYQRAQMERTVITLAFAYFLADEERYAEHAARQLRAWFIDPETRMNPNLNFSQGVPGIWDGSLWGVIDTWRWPILVDAVHLLEASDHWTHEDRASLATWFDAYQNWLRTSDLGRETDLMWNNHGSFYDGQVAALALFAGQDSIARAVLEAAKHRRIAHTFEPDGRQLYELERTRPFAYSLFNLRSYFSLAAIADHMGIDLWNYAPPGRGGIRSGLDFLAQYADTAVAWTYYDLDFDRSRLIPILRWAAIAYDDSSYLEKARLLPAYGEVVRDVPQRLPDLYQLFVEP